MQYIFALLYIPNGQGIDGISLLWYRNVLFPSKVCQGTMLKKKPLHPLFLTVPQSLLSPGYLSWAIVCCAVRRYPSQGW